MTNIDRGDMTDGEWKHWSKLRELSEIKQFMKEYGKKNANPSGMTRALVTFLTEKGVQACATYMERPTL